MPRSVKRKTKLQILREANEKKAKLHETCTAKMVKIDLAAAKKIDKIQTPNRKPARKTDQKAEKCKPRKPRKKKSVKEEKRSEPVKKPRAPRKKKSVKEAKRSEPPQEEKRSEPVRKPRKPRKKKSVKEEVKISEQDGKRSAPSRDDGLYGLLGVSPSATAGQITTAYRKMRVANMAMVDENVIDKDAAAAMDEQLTHAKDVLTNRDLRQAYDASFN